MKRLKKFIICLRQWTQKRRQLTHVLVARFAIDRYDLAAVGRYKVNKKLNIKTRLLRTNNCWNLVDPETGEILVEAGTENDVMPVDSNRKNTWMVIWTEFVYTPNDYAVVTEPVVLQNSGVAPNSQIDVSYRLLVM